MYIYHYFPFSKIIPAINILNVYIWCVYKYEISVIYTNCKQIYPLHNLTFNLKCCEM